MRWRPWRGRKEGRGPAAITLLLTILLSDLPATMTDGKQIDIAALLVKSHQLCESRGLVMGITHLVQPALTSAKVAAALPITSHPVPRRNLSRLHGGRRITCLADSKDYTGQGRPLNRKTSTRLCLGDNPERCRTLSRTRVTMPSPFPLSPPQQSSWNFMNMVGCWVACGSRCDELKPGKLVIEEDATCILHTRGRYS